MSQDNTALAVLEPGEPEQRTELAVVQGGVQPVAHMTREQVELLKRTVAKDATDDEFQMFLGLAQRYELDPYNKEIWFIKYGGVPTIITARDGYLKICQRDPEFRGINSCEVRANDDFEYEVCPETDRIRIRHKFAKGNRGSIIGAWALATHARRHPVATFVAFEEYDKSKEEAKRAQDYSKQNKGTWTQYPSAMIRKVAEAQALKRQGGISGLVTYEEMGPEYTLEGRRDDDGTFRTQPAQARPQSAPARGSGPANGGAATAPSPEDARLLEEAKAKFPRLAVAAGFGSKDELTAFFESEQLHSSSAPEYYQKANALLEKRIADLNTTSEEPPVEEGDFVPDGDPFKEDTSPGMTHEQADLLAHIDELEAEIESDPKRRKEMAAGWRTQAKVRKSMDTMDLDQLKRYSAWLTAFRDKE